MRLVAPVSVVCFRLAAGLMLFSALALNNPSTRAAEPIPAAQAAEPIKVVATIAPLHALVAGVMDGVGQPHLLLLGNASPHEYALRPSDARRLAEARVVFWIGESLELFLTRPLAALSGKATVVEVMDMPGLTRHALREGGAWDRHDDHGTPASQDDHADHGTQDPHLWLNPANAKVMTLAIARTLAATDPAHAARYTSNASAMTGRLDALDAQLRLTLRPFTAAPYIVFHDAYQYFERRYGLNAVGAIAVSPGRSPGARRLTEIRARIKTARAACVFIEPQFAPRIARTVVEGTGAQIAVLDPLGATLTPGKDAYFALMDGLAANLIRCLGAS